MFSLSPKRERIRSSGASMESKQSKKGQKPRLERRNAVKNVDYEAEGPESVGRRATWSARSPTGSEDVDSLRNTRSLDVSPSDYSNQTSFRIDGSIEGEVEMLCRSLGLSGPDDFAIPVMDWEKRRARSKDSEVASASAEELEKSQTDDEEKTQQSLESVQVEKQFVDSDNRFVLRTSGEGNGGIRGVRPPFLAPPGPATFYSPGVLGSSVENPIIELKPPPGSMARLANDKSSSSWDIIKSFGPDDVDTLSGVARGLVNCEEEDQQKEEEEEEIVIPEESIREEELRELKWEDTPEDFVGTSSYSTMNDDETSSTTTETTISPNLRLKRRIKSWAPGVLLGSGSYGRVFEAISDEGVFFAVKEVSLLDQGSNGQQCINQLEQEIALLSQFEHENIVQYYGTEKAEGKLFIFLELISQGSLVSLYQKYTLRDSQVSAYTRQILNGLNYLHERNVVHRDIKCANILVHANGSVKLADFGLAKEISKINMLKSCKGSVYWMAPEVINPKKTYGPSADIWSLGCTVLEMLTRDIPFPNLEWTVAFFMIGQGKQPPIPDHLSRDARDFISQCLKVVPDDRPTAAELLEHPFIKRSSPLSRSEFSSPNNDRLR